MSNFLSSSAQFTAKNNSMTLQEKFDAAQAKVKTLTSRPSNDVLLKLYGLYKQGSEGDNTTKKPGMFDIKEQFKWTAWSELKGTDKEAAKQKYIDLVESLF
jgi:diazepam-binding inhibitor (GABA receptor modulator, acyl-CoA-binding protein)